VIPDPLSPWRAQLDLFPADLAAALAPLLPRVALALGPLRLAAPTGDGDPDGFAGLSRRGSYERLLLSEWLLADELPDEFLRRAAAREHAFLQLSRRSPARAARAVALFDAGPASLGAPRVAHLAALLVLAARAERAGASFTWGLLQAPRDPLLPGGSRESVLRLLGARTAAPPTEDDLALHAARAVREGWDDAWIVGAARDLPGWRHGLVTVADVLDPDRRALTFTVRPPRGAPREVELTLPPGRTPAQLLGDPFAPVTAPPPPPSRRPELFVRSNLVFAANGTKVFARGPSGEILSYAVPNARSDGQSRPKRYRTRNGGTVAAVGWVRRGLVMLVIESYRLVLEHSARAPHLHRTVLYDADLRIHAPDVDDPLGELITYQDPAHGLDFADARAALFHVSAGDDGPGPVRLVAAEVSAISGNAHGALVGRHIPAFAGRQPESWRLTRPWNLVHDAEPHFELLPGGGSLEAHPGLALGRNRTLVAVQQRGEVWTVYLDFRAVAEITVPPAARVIAPFFDLGPEPPFLLVLLDPDGRTLVLHGMTERREIARADAPILDVRLSPTRAQLAYVTVAGEVVIQPLAEGDPLRRYRPEDVR
jgi:hypothetical protein